LPFKAAGITLMLAVYNLEKMAAPDGFAPPPPGLEPGILLLKYGAEKLVGKLAAKERREHKS
jgi:hypothetical protein